MSSSSINQETIRAFTALSIAPEVVDRYVARLKPMRDALKALNIRWVPVSNYHLTLCFIGNIPLSEKDNIVALMANASAGIDPFDLLLGDICLFPDHEKGGVLIADVYLDDTLLQLQKRMATALIDAGYDIYERPVYRPHMTLARLKKNIIPAELLENGVEKLSSAVTAVHLYKSWKDDGTVRNDIVASHPLTR